MFQIGTADSTDVPGYIKFNNSNKTVWEELGIFLDSGTRPESIISKTKVPPGTNIEGTRKEIETANGTIITEGFIIVTIRLDLREFKRGWIITPIKLWIAEIPFDVIIGLKDLARLKLNSIVEQIGINMLNNSEMAELGGFVCNPIVFDEGVSDIEVPIQLPISTELNRILMKHEIIFRESLDRNWVADLPKFDLELSEPVKTWPSSMHLPTRRQPMAWHAEIKLQIDDLLERGIISESQSPTYSQILLTKKKGGSLRMCIDYKALNKLTRKLGWPLPIIETLIRKLVGMEFFGKVDMTSGYHQAKMGKGRELTAFRNEWGTYVFNRVPFGLQGAPSFFQMAMQNDILKGLENICLVYLDDIIIFGETEEKFNENLDRVLTRLEEKRITIKRSKCIFGVKEIEFLGHVISKNSVKLSTDRKEALRLMIKPSSITQLRSFLGVSNYFRSFIDDYANLSRPLHQLVAKSVTKKLIWTDKLNTVFDELKAAIVKAPQLAFLKEVGEIRLHTDASDYAFGGHLTQIQDGIEVSIMFFSKCFNPTQINWSVSDKEMYAIFYGITNNRHLLMGRDFKVLSDHKALSYNNQISASQKVERWKIALSEYEITWVFIEGKHNLVADGLSRLAAETDNENDENPSTMYSLAMTQVHNEKNEEDKESLLKKHHSKSHIRPANMVNSLKVAGFNWKGMMTEVTEFCDKCSTCQMNKSKKIENHASSFTIDTGTPGEHWCMDVMEYEEDLFGYKYILVFIDSASKWTTLYKLKSIESYYIYDALIDIFCRDGTPDKLLFDQGSTFITDIVLKLLKFFEVNSVITAPRSSQENGIVEQRINTVRQTMRILIDEKFGTNETWSQATPFVQRAINASVSSATGLSPASIRYGIFNKLETVSMPEGANKDFQKDVLVHLKEKLRNRALCKKVSQGSMFVTGEKVIVRNPIYLKRDVNYKPYLGPFIVVRQTKASILMSEPGFPNKTREVKISEVHRYKE